ncbi:hypothetical protein KYK29_03945 [Shinella daejeonensis]|uniref:hypothetical protein n=1 Tax=Shinella daejeonensis TaxID=659017 RepID=UPI0020C7B43E|nr:hypothetical protein [Shinella daejeonensis]MCP8894070.1 hypothetical protein [Shinella daejeonensis]
MKFIDPNHPFYRPLWVRLLLVGICSGWTAVEFYNGEQAWGTIFLIVAAYAFAQLLLFYKPSDGVAKPEEESKEKS